MCIINDLPVFCFAYQAQPEESFPLLLLSIATGCFHFLALSSISDPTPYPEQSHVCPIHTIRKKTITANSKKIWLTRSNR